jgi:nucleotide-binding universal stress UspA family protein/CBS domain-containing protein
MAISGRLEGGGMRIHTIMRSPVFTVAGHTSLPHASAMMQRRGLRHLPVVRGRKCVGVLTERDIQQAIPSTLSALARYEWPALLERLSVTEVVTPAVSAVTPRTRVQEAARIMVERQLTGLPVLDEGDLVGLVTTTDMLNLLIRLLEDRQPPRFGEILVAVDVDNAAQQVLATALLLRQQHRAVLTVLYVMSHLRLGMPRRVDAPSTGLWARIHERQKRAAIERLSALLPADDVQQVRCEVAAGQPVAEIVKAAARIEADLIVMGSSRRRRLLRRLGRSVTENVIRHAPCPVLAVN